MSIIDFYSTKGFYKKNEGIELKLIVDKSINKVTGKITVFDFDNEMIDYRFNNTQVDEKGEVVLKIKDHNLVCGGYFAEVFIEGLGSYKTVFDVQNRWEDFPRYGYVSYFAPDQKDTAQQIEQMAKYHVNGVQFYDWQYRHDDLLADTTVYLDPFNREMSLDTVNSYIDECHKRNMSAMPYLAVYAASVEFWNEHKDWGMFDKDGKALMFEDFLGIVNPSYNSPWFKHLDNECNEVLTKTNFDGLHIDQYGDPKEAYDNEGNEIDIPKAFVHFINHQKDKDKGTIVFNAVGNWPIEQLTKSKADFMYIEVWEYTPSFADLRDICINAREKSGQKPLVIPIYIKKDSFHNVLIADAIINSAGGTHLEIGDGQRLLSDPYFPKAEDIGDLELSVLRKYWDFVVGYQRVLGPKAVWKSIDVQTSKEVMIIARQNDKYTAINFVNCMESADWFKKIDEPSMLKDISVQCNYAKKIKRILFASPDNESMELESMDYNVENGQVKFNLPSLHYWSMIVIEEE